MADFHYDLFGGSAAWDARDWTSSDDRVRGGKSQSYLDVPKPDTGRPTSAIFHGTLDIQTLGGAGFASQRSVDGLHWDLSKGDGILLKLGRSDDKKYTLILKDTVLPKRPDGREQSTVSWEYDFKGKDHQSCFIPWSDFKPTYRGKPKSGAQHLNLTNVQRISIMNRSFFGDQEGPFWLEIRSISAAINPRGTVRGSDAMFSEKAHQANHEPSWKGWLCGFFRL